MKQYLRNLWTWVTGWGRFRSIIFMPGWSATSWRWWLLYLFDVGLNVLTGGAVGTISRRAQRHRRGWVWDKLLDALERFDRDHGPRAGRDLWDTEECSVLVQIGATVFWIAVLLLA